MMMVIFVSKSDKRAIKTTRWILDAFADRIGTDVWQTVITAEGLKMVHMLLRNHATKSMSVSCHWLRSRSRSELLWIVGDKTRFNEYGIVPVNSTMHNIMHNNWENDWHNLPAIKALAGIAALFHDWGKSNIAFQKKLKSAKHSLRNIDPYRHEWISCKLIEGLVKLSNDFDNDTGWINMLRQGDCKFCALINEVNKNLSTRIMKLPPIASMICWLILSHHKMPAPGEKELCYNYADKLGDAYSEMLSRIQPNWGYCNDGTITEISFSENLLETSKEWQRQLKRWLRKLQDAADDLKKIYTDNSIRLLLNYARLAMMFSDYYVSSKDAGSSWCTESKLYANTKKDGNLKQYLDEHLVRVAKKSVDAAHKLPLFTEAMGKAVNISSLRKKSPSAYAWQDKAVNSIRKIIAEQERNNLEDTGWFVVNMASTGCGKTFANAKIMQAMGQKGDSLRYTLALGLRTLTLQTGYEYRQRIGLNSKEMAVLIGAAAIKSLHDMDKDDDLACNDSEIFMSGQFDGDIDVDADFLDIFFNGHKNKAANKNKALLYAPVLATTIDHIMPATECTRGGRHLLPMMRMMSSDLVIDEIDDFTGSDLVAIARLINLAGMFGRKVIISSATIPPDLAEGLFSAYQSGYGCYVNFFKRPLNINCVWSDEFKTDCELMIKREEIAACLDFREMHQRFVSKRIEKLKKQAVKRKGVLINCDAALQAINEDKQTLYFEEIKRTIIVMHKKFALQDKKSGKYFSVGVVRMANIEPCVKLSKYLSESDWPADIMPKLMTYHSRQVLLLRHEQEKYLDSVLKRKEKYSKTISVSDAVMRQHLDNTKQSNIIFLVVATPVEEVGRDHDFDWAVVEPSSYRSIVQLAGRVLRHRELAGDIAAANIAIMRYNYRGIKQGSGIVFNKPGFECNEYRLKSHDLNDLVEKASLEQAINAIPRIVRPKQLHPQEKLVDLEHQIMHDFKSLKNIGPMHLHGWQDEYWWMTGIPQRLKPFRANSNDEELVYVFEDGKLNFCEYDKRTKEYVNVTVRYDISIDEESVCNERWWLPRDYYKLLQSRAELENYDLKNVVVEALNKCSKLYGTIVLTTYGDNKDSGYIYSDQLGLYKK